MFLKQRRRRCFFFFGVFHKHADAPQIPSGHCFLAFHAHWPQFIYCLRFCNTFLFFFFYSFITFSITIDIQYYTSQYYIQGRYTSSLVILRY